MELAAAIALTVVCVALAYSLGRHTERKLWARYLAESIVNGRMQQFIDYYNGEKK